MSIVERIGKGTKTKAHRDMGVSGTEMDMYSNLYSWSNSESFFNNDNDIDGVDDLVEYDDLDETDLYLD